MDIDTLTTVKNQERQGLSKVYIHSHSHATESHSMHPVSSCREDPYIRRAARRATSKTLPVRMTHVTCVYICVSQVDQLPEKAKRTTEAVAGALKNIQVGQQTLVCASLRARMCVCVCVCVCVNTDMHHVCVCMCVIYTTHRVRWTQPTFAYRRLKLH